MTGSEFIQTRKSLGLSAYQMGLALGYKGSRSTIRGTIKRYETGHQDISAALAVRIRALLSSADYSPPTYGSLGTGGGSGM